MIAKRHDTALRWMAGAAIGFVGVAIAVSLFVHMRWASLIGEGDGANTVVVARNLLEGRGFTVDYVAMHLRAWSSVHHAEDSFPLLHPALIAGLALLSRDVVTAAHLSGACLLAAYLVGLPLLALRWWGTAPAVVLCAGLLAQEGLGTYFARPLNDPAAMVAIGASALLLVRAIELPDGRGATRALGGCAAFAAIATELKLSAAFVVLVECAALVVLDEVRPRGARLRRAFLVAAVAAVLQVPLLVWHTAVFGAPGVPQNALGRNIARVCGMSEDFWRCYDRTRVWLPRHPDFLVTIGEWIERDGFVAALIVAPLRRVAVGLRHAVVEGEVLPLPWLTLLGAASLGRSASARIARLGLLVAAGALLLPAYSHYEARYLHPLRPFIAIAAACIVRDALELVSTERRIGLEAAAVALFIVSIVWGATHAYWWQAPSVHLLALVVGATACAAHLAMVGWPVRREPARTAVEVGAAVGLCFAFAVLASNGARRLLEPLTPDRDRDLGAWIATATVPADILLANRVWSVSFWSRRMLVKIPYHAEDVCAAAARYGATQILLEPGDLLRQPDLTRFLAPDAPIEREGTAIRRLSCEAAP